MDIITENNRKEFVCCMTLWKKVWKSFAQKTIQGWNNACLTYNGAHDINRF